MKICHHRLKSHFRSTLSLNFNQLLNIFGQFTSIILTTFPHNNIKISKNSIGNEGNLILLHLTNSELVTARKDYLLVFQFPKTCRKRIPLLVFLFNKNLTDLITMMLQSNPFLIEIFQVDVILTSINVTKMENLYPFDS